MPRQHFFVGFERFNVCSTDFATYMRNHAVLLLLLMGKFSTVSLWRSCFNHVLAIAFLGPCFQNSTNKQLMQTFADQSELGLSKQGRFPCRILWILASKWLPAYAIRYWLPSSSWECHGTKANFFRCFNQYSFIYCDYSRQMTVVLWTQLTCFFVGSLSSFAFVADYHVGIPSGIIVRCLRGTSWTWGGKNTAPGHYIRVRPSRTEIQLFCRHYKNIPIMPEGRLRGDLLRLTVNGEWSLNKNVNKVIKTGLPSILVLYI